ncbi:MAG: response regulator [Proteobacteria bacterium]|nr:response regulator [Pseudomonadota bacterium]MBU1586071.1 response regulator [Pseudomonadota bacterium]MBU2453229.1 response regulator [Pseudomonadota bacterium]MBU2628320.1 response regulator [Pseudomonadota bacterium]
MAKPTYEELEKKVTALEQKVGHISHLEAQFRHLENQFSQVEKQLRQRQRMDSLGTLAQGVAHDFNNILSGIMAYLNILSLTADNFSPSQKTYVQNISNAVKRGAATIKQFQQLSGKTISAKANIDVYTVAREVFHLLEKTTDKMIEKKLDIEKGQIFICADINEIHQVFMNLGTNAIHAIEEKGVQKGDYIRLSAKPSPVNRSKLKHLSQGEFYHLCFEDTGCGMPEHVVKKAFDPLFTTKNGSKNSGQGLGLAMVHDIVTKRHDSHIEVVSKLGKGTVFHLFLPKADDACGMPDSTLTVQGGTETILVVDDDVSVRESIKTALEDFGYQVITGCDGEEGLALFKENQKTIHAVLLDMIMPKMSGKDVLRQMLKIDPDVKVIISSGHMKEQYNDPIIQFAKNYLNKPFEIDELESTLRQVLAL